MTADRLVTSAGGLASGRPAVAVVVSSYDNVKPLKTGATAIRRRGCGVVGREGVEGRGVEGRLYNIHNKIYT